VRALAEHFKGRARRIELAGLPVTIQGARLEIAAVEVRLTPRERSLLEYLLDSEGAMLSKSRLADAAWGTGIDEHTVEVAVNRLRRKLGPAASALETANRRGYRLVARCA
jgi:DNA-binding response OmpR family regulator